MSATTEPLRDRKKAALLAAFERSAVELAHQHGYENVTVEMICDDCMASPRTYYNYVGSKEAAILGPRTPVATSEQIERFVTEPGTDILDDFMTMVIDSLTENPVDRELYQMRQKVIYSTPELSARRLAIDGELEGFYRQVIARRLRVNGSEDGDRELDDQAHMVIALARGMLTFTAAKWLEPAFDSTVRELIEDSIALMRRVLSPQSAGSARDPH